MPARRGAWAIYEVFPTAADGELFIGVTSDQQWTRFTEEFGLQDLAADPRLATNLMRCHERSWLIPALKEVDSGIAARRRWRAAASAPASPGRRSGSRPTCSRMPHLLATGGLLDVFISRAGGTEGKKVGLPALPIEFGAARERPGLRRQPPRLGEHNAEVLAGAGFSPAEIAALAEMRVIVGGS